DVCSSDLRAGAGSAAAGILPARPVTVMDRRRLRTGPPRPAGAHVRPGGVRAERLAGSATWRARVESVEDRNAMSTSQPPPVAAGPSLPPAAQVACANCGTALLGDHCYA